MSHKHSSTLRAPPDIPQKECYLMQRLFPNIEVLFQYISLFYIKGRNSNDVTCITELTTIFYSMLLVVEKYLMAMYPQPVLRHDMLVFFLFDVAFPPTEDEVLVVHKLRR